VTTGQIALRSNGRRRGPKAPHPPKHLQAAGRRLWRETLQTGEFIIEARWEAETLAAACTALDRAHQAHEVLERDGITALDRYDRPKQHPAAAVERDSISTMLKCFKALGLEPPKQPPGPRATSTGY
jgi:P27 family predicted phage terminase small subunit